MDMVEVSIDSVRVSLVSQHRIVVLKDPEERFLPIWIGPFEADAITIALQGSDVARPLTHDLMRNIISETGAVASHILVSELRDDIFFRALSWTWMGDMLELDSRPSDAIALAVRLKCPIYVSDSVMDKASITPSRSIEVVSPEEAEKLSAFRDLIEDLNLSDLDSSEDRPKSED